MAVFAAGYSAFLLMYGVQPLLPIFAREFHVSAASSSLALSATTGCLAIAMIVVGAIGEGWPRKATMTVSMTAVALLMVASAFVPGWSAFLAIRAVEGVVLAGLPAVAMAYIGEEVHPNDVGVSMGCYVGSGALGGMTGRLLTGTLVDYIPWRPALVIVGAIGLMAAAIFAWKLPAGARTRPHGTSSRAILAAYAMHAKDPIVLALVTEAFVIFGALVTVYNYSSFRLLQPPFSLSQTAVASVFALYVFGFFSSSLVGALSRRFRRPALLRVGLLSMALGVGLTSTTWLPVIIVGIGFVTVGFFATQSVASSWLGLHAKTATAQASALYLFVYYMGASTMGSIGGIF